MTIPDPAFPFDSNFHAETLDLGILKRTRTLFTKIYNQTRRENQRSLLRAARSGAECDVRLLPEVTHLVVPGIHTPLSTLSHLQCRNCQLSSPSLAAPVCVGFCVTVFRSFRCSDLACSTHTRPLLGFSPVPACSARSEMVWYPNGQSLPDSNSPGVMGTAHKLYWHGFWLQP